MRALNYIGVGIGVGIDVEGSKKTGRSATAHPILAPRD
jgi:hypothetical protein